MQCPACTATASPDARYCPQCGTALAHGASIAPDNVVYLTPTQPPAGDISINPATGTYAPSESPASPTPPSSHQVDNVADSFFDRAATSNWTLEPETEREPRTAGTLLATITCLLLAVALGVYILELRRGAYGQIAGGFILLAMISWIIYLSLPRREQHDGLVNWHQRFTRRVDRAIDPIRGRTQAQINLRRERERFRSMRHERTRRITELGEAAYRQFRAGEAAPEIMEHGRRVLAIEQQMLLQDARMHELDTPGDQLSQDTPQDDGEVPTRGRRPRRRRRR